VEGVVSPTMPLDAFFLALGSAFLHALWNLLLGRERDPVAATAVALAVAATVFLPVAALRWDAEPEVWPYIAVTTCLQLVYFAFLATAYRRAEVSVVYPVARGTAPVLVLLVSVAALGAGIALGQAAGVLLVGLGVVLVRGLGSRDLEGVIFGLAVAASIAAYTLVDNRGIEYADPIVYLEASMIPVALASVGFVALRDEGGARLRVSVRPSPALAGVLSFGAYALVLAALARASAAPVAAVRETSVLIAAALAVPLLHERVSATRIAGAALVVGGVALIALA
jgi:drug/metabolite transporter (DMT)-like permease